MARLTPLWTAQPLTDDAAIADFLGARGVAFERWELPAHVSAIAAQDTVTDADKQALLDAFSAKLAAVADGTPYKSADVVAIRPHLPGVDGALARFDRVHRHDDDEIRAIVGGRGIFGFLDDVGRQYLLLIEAGEYISVPAGAWHWFYCDDTKNITALRIFKDAAGWVAHYRDEAAAGGSPA